MRRPGFPRGIGGRPGIRSGRPRGLFLRIAGFALLIAAGAADKAGGSAASLQAALNADVARTPGVRVSIRFASLDGLHPPVSVGEENELPPASVQKIVTSIGALDILGPGHHFVTRASTDGVIESEQVRGNLYLNGNGDPFLVTERLWLLAHSLAATGIHTIGGDLVVGAEPIADLDSIRAAEKSDSPYSAPVSLLAVNFNHIAFAIRPGARVGDGARVEMDPFPVATLSIDNRVVTGSAGSPCAIEASRAGTVWTFEGKIPSGSGTVWIHKGVRDPALLAGSIFSGLLRQNGIEVQGAVRAGRAPARPVPVDSLESLPLGVLLRSMNGYSNNFMADLLLAALGQGGDARSGLDRIRSWLRGRPGGATPSSDGATRSHPESAEIRLRLYDGSGLSPRNRSAARAIVDLLVWASHEEKIFADLYASLPRPGDDGTLERRFREGDAPPLRAKTGTLGDIGVSSIAGYIDHPTAGRYAFCILQQAPAESRLTVADLRDREEKWLREFVTP
jgi:serine-type D-Ala-D-Ala carboxypeptidase/endopeptidase (penicillin-binding protein 4)